MVPGGGACGEEGGAGDGGGGMGDNRPGKMRRVISSISTGQTSTDICLGIGTGKSEGITPDAI